MDDRQFDRLTRLLASGVSRRRGIRVLAGAGAALLAAARGRDVSANHGWIPFGGPCYDDAQCDQTGVYPAAVICGNNGFDYDGPYNCCVTSDGPCNIDEHCCWTQECIGGYCADRVFGATGPGGPGSLGLGEPCGDPIQCYSGSGTETTCADNGIKPGGHCCTFYGFGCVTSGHCCGSLICSNGVCTVPYEGFG